MKQGRVNCVKVKVDMDEARVSLLCKGKGKGVSFIV